MLLGGTLATFAVWKLLHTAGIGSSPSFSALRVSALTHPGSVNPSSSPLPS